MLEMDVTHAWYYVHEHPYYTAGGTILALFIIGFLFSFFVYVGTGVGVVGRVVYYGTYPLHAPIRYGFRRLNESS